MSTAFTRERDAKRAAKAAKKKADKEEKNRQIQAKVDEEFNEKQAAAAAAGDPVQKLKAWCQKPPYADLTNNVKVSRNLARFKDAAPIAVNYISLCYSLRGTPTCKS